VAQQDAERSKFLVMKVLMQKSKETKLMVCLQAEQEKEAAIIRAEGESEAAAMIAKVTFVI
jgi:regulator of protease activity HflC (stomatin/prohibitin superfamily)